MKPERRRRRSGDKNRLGENPDPSLETLLSNERQEDGDTLPTWLTLAGDDKAVPVASSSRSIRSPAIFLNFPIVSSQMWLHRG